MNEYIKRVSDVGLKLEDIKRSIIEGDIDSKKIQDSFNAFASNLHQAETNIGELIQILPIEQFTPAEHSLSKLSKGRVQKLRNLREKESSPTVLTDSIGELCQIQSDFNNLIKDITSNISEESKLNYPENEEIPQLKCFSAFKKNENNPELEIAIQKSKENEEITNTIAQNMNINTDDLQELKKKNMQNEEFNLLNLIKQQELIGELLKKIENDTKENQKNQKNGLIDKIKDIEKKHSQLFKLSKQSLDCIKGKNEYNLIDPDNEISKKLKDIDVNLQNLIMMENDKLKELDGYQQEMNFCSPKIKSNIENHKKLKNRQIKELNHQENEQLEHLCKGIPEIIENLGPILSTGKINALNKHVEVLLENIDFLTNKVESLNKDIAQAEKLSKENQESQALGQLKQQEEKKNIDNLKHSEEKIQELNKNLAELTHLNKSLNEQTEASSNKLKHYADLLDSVGKKISEVLIKTDYVGDTLMEILPESSLKEKMDKYQDQYEAIINEISNTTDTLPERICELLDLMDLYEEANGTQASRLAGISEKFVKDDFEKLSNASKLKPSMKSKKALRSGRVSGVSPINAMKSSLEDIKLSSQDSLIINDPSLEEELKKNEITEDMTNYYEEISKTNKKVCNSYSTNFIILKQLEIERDEIIVKEIITYKVDDENLKEKEEILESFEKAKISEKDSFDTLINKLKIKINIERRLNQFMNDCHLKDNVDKISGELEKISRTAIKESLNVAVLLNASTSEINLIKEQFKNILFIGKPKDIIEKIINLLQVLINIETIKQKAIESENISQFLLEILSKYQQLTKNNSENIQNLWKIIIKLIGKDSDKLLTKSLLFTLPQQIPEELSQIIALFKETQGIIEKNLDINSTKIAEFLQRNEEFINNSSEFEESLDETLRKSIKEISSIEESAQKKQISTIKEDFEETSSKIYTSISDKFEHFSTDLILLGKIERLKKQIADSLQKKLKALDSELAAKTNELETLKNSLESEVRAIQNKLDITEGSLKETKQAFDKLLKEKHEKDLEVVSLMNNNSNLQNDIDQLKNDISRLEDEISNNKGAIRTSRTNLKEKNEEIARLEERLRDLESVASKPVVDEAAVKNLRSEVRKRSEILSMTQKALDQYTDDLTICKRDKELLTMEVARNEETIRSLREELGRIKAKILHVESISRELEEKNRLGVDRNDKEISQLYEKLAYHECECNLLLKQLEPSSNYRRFYTGLRTEIAGIANQKEILEINLKECIEKIKLLDKENETLKYENRMMEKYKNEWNDAMNANEILKKKVSLFEESQKFGGDANYIIEKLNSDLESSMKNAQLAEEKSNILEEKLNRSHILVQTVRKKQAYFKMFMTSRIKSYYRFSIWRNYARKPLGFTEEDPDLVELYSASRLVTIPIENSIHYLDTIQGLLQKLLNNCPIILQYKKFAIKSKPMEKYVLINLLHETFIEKNKFDISIKERQPFTNLPDYFLNRLKDLFGASTVTVLSEIIQSLYALYQSECSYIIFACKMLQYLDPTPVSVNESPTLLQLYSNLSELWKQSSNYIENSDTLGVFSLIETIDSVRNVLGNDSSIYKNVMKNLKFKGKDNNQIIILRIMHEVFRSNYKMKHSKLSEEQSITEWIAKEEIEAIENANGVEFYYSMSKAGFENQCNELKVTGIELLCAIIDALIIIRSMQIDQTFKYFMNESILSKEQFQATVKEIKPTVNDETLEALYMHAERQSDDQNGITPNAFYRALSSNQISGFFIPFEDTPLVRRKSLPEEVKSPRRKEEEGKAKTGAMKKMQDGTKKIITKVLKKK